MKKLIFALLVLLGVGGYFLISNKTTTTTDSNNVVITQYGQGNVFLYLPLYIAQEEGIFKKNGLDVHSLLKNMAESRGIESLVSINDAVVGEKKIEGNLFFWILG